MSNNNFSQIAAFIWSVADLLRGDFKQSQYGRVILPFTLLRRLECVLAESKAAAAQNSSMGVPQPSAPQPSAAASDGFMNIPDGLEEELPFS